LEGLSKTPRKTLNKR